MLDIFVSQHSTSALKVLNDQEMKERRGVDGSENREGDEYVIYDQTEFLQAAESGDKVV